MSRIGKKPVTIPSGVTANIGRTKPLTGIQAFFCAGWSMPAAG